MKQLLLVAHGSRHQASNDEIAGLAAELKPRGEFFFDRIDHAFLEFAAPTVAECIDQAVADGVVDIVLLPYFLAAGSHVRRDLPEVVARKQAEHPGVTIDLCPHFGAAGGVAELLLAVAMTRES